MSTTVMILGGGQLRRVKLSSAGKLSEYIYILKAASVLIYNDNNEATLYIIHQM